MTLAKRFTALILLGLASNAPAADLGTYTIHKAWITEVYDGDTLYLTDPTVPPMFGGKVGIRVEGIDTPEKKSQCPDPAAAAHEHALALQAQALMASKIAAASSITVEHVQNDKYGGRYVGSLMLDGVDVAPAMIASGLALPYHGEKKVGWCH